MKSKVEFIKPEDFPPGSRGKLQEGSRWSVEKLWHKKIEGETDQNSKNSQSCLYNYGKKKKKKIHDYISNIKIRKKKYTQYKFNIFLLF